MKIKFTAFVLIVLVGLGVYLLLNSSADYRNYDFIENYRDAETGGLKGNDFIDNNYPSAKYQSIDHSVIVALAKAFTASTSIINNNNSRPLYMSDVREGAVRLKIPKGQGEGGNFEFIFYKKSEDHFYKLTVDKYKNGHITLIQSEGVDFVNDYKVENSYSSKDDYVIFLIFFNGKILVIEQNTIVLKLKVPAADRSGAVEITPSYFKTTGDYSIRFHKLSDHTRKRLNKALNNMTWSSANIQPVYTEDNAPPNYIYYLYNRVSKRCIALPVNSTVSHRVVVPADSFLEFGYKPIDIAKEIPEDLSFKVIIKTESEKITKDYTCSPEADWKDERIDLLKFQNQEIEIAFHVKSKNEKENNDTHIILLSNPILRTKRNTEDKNILLISLDTLRADHLGCYGYKRNTSPYIDKFAEKYLIFENSFAHAPSTLPSHMSMFSSMYPLESGHVHGNKAKILKESRLAPEINNLTEHLHTSGYKTLASTGGGWVTSYLGFDQAFEEYWNEDPRKNVEMMVSAERCQNWIKENRNLKWFIFFHTYEIHAPYRRDYFEPDETDGEAKKTIARYDSGILHADFYVNRLLKTLEDEGLLDNTLVIITSDHGESFYDHASGRPERKNEGWHSHTLYDNLIKVPIILGGLKEFKKSKYIDDLVCHADLMPTILDYLDIEYPDNIRGRSLRKIINGEKLEEKLVYSEAVAGPVEKEKKSLRSSEYKLIINSNFKNKADRYEFYKISEDPNERNNLANELRELREKYIQRIEHIIRSIAVNRSKINKKTTGDKSHSDLEKQLKALGYLGN